MSTSLNTLIAKLNSTCRQAALLAANNCLARGHYEVDLEHLLLALLDEPASDVALVLRASRIDPHALHADIERELQRLKTGNTRTPVFSKHLIDLLEQAWLIASLDSQTGRIRSGHLLLALVSAPDLAQFAERMSPLLRDVRVTDLKHKFDELTAGSREVERSNAAQGEENTSHAAPSDATSGVPSKTPALDTYTSNLTQRAREGQIDPVIGREAEIRQTIDILMRRRQNNPIMTGEAGVGKTAVVEGLALRIAADDVPAPLKGVALHVLDMGLLQAGASVKGEFENRLKNVIDEVKKSPHPIILFIDEAHTIIGAGGQAGQNDAANLLKPALARGELRTVAATTWSEYKKYFEKDAALARRFQVVKIEEPNESLAAAMLRGMASLMEKHFNVRVLDDAITEAVRLSHRYISGRQLPDKAISVLDTACAKVALAHSSTPAAIDDTKKRIERIDAEIAALEREVASGALHDERLAELRQLREEDLQHLAEDEARYDKERVLVTEIVGLRADIDAARVSSADAEQAGKAQQAREALAMRVAELYALQGGQPMVPLQVDGHVVAEIVASWTGIPLGRMVKDEIQTVLNLQPLLAARVIGQDHALEAIAQRVRTASANLEDPNKPRGVFMFVGPSGVGKTETALALADVLYGGERKMVTINMSEYQEAHSVSGLKGSPPGYVGYGEGGVLTEAVRRNPYSVVLLDEVEKAHPDVLEMFFQVFDKGTMDDAEGREIDFRNTLIILTSNIGSQAVMQACLNKSADELPDADALAETLRPQLYKAFKPAFLGRMKVVPYYPISDDVLAEIIELKLERIRRRIESNHQAVFEWDESLIDAVLARCTEVDSGARNVDHILNGTLLPEVAQQVLERIANGAAIERISVRASEAGEFDYAVV
ncbi:type VI secretion system ATPase TssH [Paraburkholderia rhynchosiae]|uniref:Protein ClpV1 n=1 Tax=Paraburkholderia rhynchosiae TaxID=487049 RepID=A0A2N7WJI0_9BURK|nr:type VI secretion system ATPase TssH [Paraburkholderia rhynchosiae]PMS29511.1 type VI secretion system ATPase TssH [Paraburkholderia rhynchosiae]CAB3706175.1 Protein ClpV1 [Paraburkholderia rhynchosiae]